METAQPCQTHIDNRSDTTTLFHCIILTLHPWGRRGLVGGEGTKATITKETGRRKKTFQTKTASDDTHRQTGHHDIETESAQWDDSVKIQYHGQQFQ